MEYGVAQIIRREEYSPPDFHAPEAKLSFDLDAEITQVISRMRFERTSVGTGGGSLVLDRHKSAVGDQAVSNGPESCRGRNGDGYELFRERYLLTRCALQALQAAP